MRDPAIHIEWDRAVGDDPLSVIFACNVNMRAGGMSTLAGWITDHIPGFQFRTQWGALVSGKVQVKMTQPVRSSPSLSRSSAMPSSFERTTSPSAMAVAKLSTPR